MFHVETINVYDHYGLEKEQMMAFFRECGLKIRDHIDL